MPMSGSRPIRCFVAKAFLVVFLSIVLSWPVSSGPMWVIETVDNNGGVGTYSSIDVDSKNNPHISYYDWVNKDLKYAYWDGNAWQIVTVDSAGDVGQYSSIVLTDTDVPLISYYDSTNKKLGYAKGNKTVPVTFDITKTYWHEPYGVALDTGYSTSIALDGDIPHILCYSPADGGSVIHFYRSEPYNVASAYFKFVEIGANCFSGAGSVYLARGSGICVDKNHNIHAVYMDRGNDKLQYRQGFRISTSPLQYGWGSPHGLKTGDTSYPDITTTTDDRPVVSYYFNDPANSKSYLIRAYDQGGGSWAYAGIDSTTLSGSRYIGQFTSLAIDRNNYFHISYQDASNTKLKYVRNINYYDKWTVTSASGLGVTNGRFTTTVDSDGSVGRDTSLVLDSRGLPHISYYDSTNSALKYARIK